MTCGTVHDPVVCTTTPNSRDRRVFENMCVATNAGFNENLCRRQNSRSLVSGDEEDGNSVRGLRGSRDAGISAGSDTGESSMKKKD